MPDCCIIGGGIIGLSIARELAGRGLSVQVLTRDAVRDTASWAAAGIFPPTPTPIVGGPEVSAGDAFTAWSDRLHRQWSLELASETGIDNGLAACGGLHVAAGAAALERLRAEWLAWQCKGARCEWLDTTGVVACEPALTGTAGQGGILGGYLLPDEMQIRPPRHLEALKRSCRDRGVEIVPTTDVRSIELRAGRIEGVTTPSGVRTAGCYCLAAGAWSEGLAMSLGLQIQTRPIRGQILLLRLPQQILKRVINLGLEYLVPREDGRLLVGSTLEDAGFDTSTTPEAIQRLLVFVHSLLGDLPDAVQEQVWAGLRPGSVDGRPFIGKTPACTNGFVAAGHFRAGLHQSTGTAVLLADMITGCTPSVDPSAFDPARPLFDVDASPNNGSSARPPDSVAAYLARAAAEASDASKNLLR